MGGTVTVGPVVVELVRPLRRAVLRPGRPAGESAYPGDDHPLSAHVAVRAADESLGAEEDDVVAVGTVLPEAPPWEPDREGVWRIRGMATHPDHRRSGLGALVVEALLHHAAVHGGGLVWCNARLPARSFYERAGFERRGEELELPGIGPHVQMWRMITPAPSAAPPRTRPRPAPRRRRFRPG
jgi:GNAT superfamily N-acetyltransferase